jgi:hypothetical protein
VKPVLPLDAVPLTQADLKEMFKLFAVDGHPRGPEDVRVWMVAAQVGRWTRAQAAAATLTVVATWTGFRIMPGHVAEQIVADRARIRERWYCPDPPRHLGSDPAAEIAWRRRAQASYADRALMALAVGEPLEQVPLVLDIEPEPRLAIPAAEMAWRVKVAAAEIAREHDVDAADGDEQMPVRRVTLDPDIRREVREDLERRRAAQDPEHGQAS